MMVPFLQLASDGKEHELQEAANYIADSFRLGPDDREEPLPSGNQTRLSNRVGWCRTHLKVAGAIEYVRRGVFRITERGLDLLKSHPEGLSLKILDQFQEHYDWFHSKAKKEPASTFSESTGSGTPEEQIQALVADLKQQLSVDLLEHVKKMDPLKFEGLVLELLKAMGYGGFRPDAASTTKKSHDEGIDGIINEDQLGLDVIYVQAKRWKDGNTVGRQEVQGFVGALVGKHVSKGVFITSSQFAHTAEDYVKGVPQKVILIDGPKLADLMIEYNIGVSVASAIHVKKVDTDYFEDL